MAVFVMLSRFTWLKSKVNTQGFKVKLEKMTVQGGGCMRVPCTPVKIRRVVFCLVIVTVPTTFLNLRFRLGSLAGYASPSGSSSTWFCIYVYFKTVYFVIWGNAVRILTVPPGWFGGFEEPEDLKAGSRGTGSSEGLEWDGPECKSSKWLRSRGSWNMNLVWSSSRDPDCGFCQVYATSGIVRWCRTEGAATVSTSTTENFCHRHPVKNLKHLGSVLKFLI